jgi:hypothetical protein
MEPATGILLPDMRSVIGIEHSTAILPILLPILPILVQTASTEDPGRFFVSSQHHAP